MSGLVGAGVIHIATASNTVASAVPVPTTCTSSTLLNGDFENPGGWDGAGQNENSITNSAVKWQTTATDHLIEFWRSNGTGNLTGNNNGIPIEPESGRQFVELNATQASNLYQDLPTESKPMAYSFWHRGRGDAGHNGVDTMQLSIGAPGGTLTPQIPDGQTSALITDGPYVWGHYTGVYVVPAGQTVTRFSFESVSTSSGDQSVGNFLDDIAFTNSPCLPATKTVQNVTSGAGSINRPGDTLRYTITTPNNGGSAASSATLTDSIPTNTTYVPGSLTLNGVPRTDAVGDDVGDVSGGIATAYIGTGASASAGGAFAPGATATMTFDVTVDAGVADGTAITNTAHTNYVWAPMSNLGPSQMDTTQVSTTVTTPDIDLVKSIASRTDVNANGAIDTGDVIHYSYLVTNTGSLPLSTVGVTDTAGITVVCPNTTLAAGASETCTADYTVTQADTDAGAVASAATAAGTPAGSYAAVSPVSTTSSTLSQGPQLSLSSTPSRVAVTAAGDRIDDTVIATNSGNVTLSNVTIPGGTNCTPAAPATLAVGAQLTCTRTHITTQAEMDAGTVTLPDPATARAPGGAAVAASATSTVTATQRPGLAVGQSTTRSTITAVGQSVPLTVVLTNTGTVTLTSPTTTLVRQVDGSSVTKPVTVTCPSTASLAPGESMTCTASTLSTQADLDAGRIVTRATASARTTQGAAVVAPAASTVTVPAGLVPALTISAAGAVTDTTKNGLIGVGDTARWYYQVKNTGNVTLINPKVQASGSEAVTCPTGALAPGDTMTCFSARHTISAADMDAKFIATTAIAAAKPACAVGATCATTQSGSTNARIALTPNTGIAVTPKVAVKHLRGGTAMVAGDLVRWWYVVTNTADRALSAIVMQDSAGNAVACEDTTLVPHASTTCRAPLQAISPAEAKSGLVAKVASASGMLGGITILSAPVRASVIASAPAVKPAKTTIDHGTGGGNAAQQAESGASSDDAGSLAETGASGVPQTVLASIMLLLSGLFLLVVASRRQHRARRRH